AVADEADAGATARAERPGSPPQLAQLGLDAAAEPHLPDRVAMALLPPAVRPVPAPAATAAAAPTAGLERPAASAEPAPLAAAPPQDAGAMLTMDLREQLAAARAATARPDAAAPAPPAASPGQALRVQVYARRAEDAKQDVVDWARLTNNVIVPIDDAPAP